VHAKRSGGPASRGTPPAKAGGLACGQGDQGGALSGPGMMNNVRFLFKPIFQIALNLNHAICDLPKVKKIQIKYGFTRN
jgi:hypothetical protein